MKYLIIYNVETGDIATMTNITDDTEKFNGGLIVDVPAGKTLEKINPETGEPIFTEYVDPVDTVKEDITNIQLALTEQYEANLALEYEVTNTQLALTELYEANQTTTTTKEA